MYRKGKLLYNGLKSELLANQTILLNIEIEYSVDLSRAVEVILNLGFEVNVDGGKLLVEASRESGAEINRALITAGITANLIFAQQPTLEETFFAMTGAH